MGRPPDGEGDWLLNPVPADENADTATPRLRARIRMMWFLLLVMPKRFYPRYVARSAQFQKKWNQEREDRWKRIGRL